MTLQEQAYKKIDRMSEDGLRILLDLINKMDEISSIQVLVPDTSNDASPNTIAASKDSTDVIEKGDISEDVRSEMNDSDESSVFLSILDSLNPADIADMSKSDKKRLFFQTGGKINYDEDAYWSLREGSMV